MTKLPPSLRLLIYFGIMVSLIGSGAITGWYAHKYYGVSNELAINKSDAIAAGEIYTEQAKGLKYVDDWQKSIDLSSDCSKLSFDQLLKSPEPRQ